jgi:hypothetical protein
VLSGDNEPTPQNGNVTVARSLCQEVPITAESRFSNFSLISNDAAQTQNNFGINLIYNSFYADPRPIVELETTIPLRFAIPPLVSLRGQIASIEQPFEIFTATDGLNENRNETIRQVAQFDATNLPTGVHPYTLT